jgi:hypothetical protein
MSKGLARDPSGFCIDRKKQKADLLITKRFAALHFAREYEKGATGEE